MTKPTRWWIAGAPLLAACGPPVHSCGALGGGGVNSVERWDGGLVDGGSVENGFLDFASCEQLCPTSNRCQVLASGLVQCSTFCVGGRVPPGLASLSGVDASPGSWLARMAELEAAAVKAFAHLADELNAHRLPAFAAAALEAAHEELGHAESVTRLALRYGHCPLPPVIAPSELRSFEALALDNAAEGCGREGFGSLVNAQQARTAADPVVAQTMAQIAEEERAHADWSFALAATLMPRLTVAQRRRVREAQEQTLESLGDEGVSETTRVTLGLMDRSEAARTARSLLEQRRL